MTLDYKKMFLIVTEEAVVKGHFTRRVAADNSSLFGRQVSYILSRFVPAVIGGAFYFLDPDSVLLAGLGFLFSALGGGIFISFFPNVWYSIPIYLEKRKSPWN